MHVQYAVAEEEEACRQLSMRLHGWLWVHITLWLLRVTTLQFEQIRRCCFDHGSGLSSANLTLQSLTQGAVVTDAADPFQGHKGGNATQPGLSKSTCTQPQSPPKKSCQQAM